MAKTQPVPMLARRTKKRPDDIKVDVPGMKFTAHADDVTLTTGDGETQYTFWRENVVLFELTLEHGPVFLAVHNQLMAWYNG